MARTLRIPGSARPGLAAILQMDVKHAQGLVAALRDLPPGSSPADLMDWLAAKLKDPLPVAMDALVSTVLSLHSLQSNLELPVDELVDDLLDAMAASGYDELKVPPGRRSAFRTTLRELLMMPSLQLAFKHADVLGEHQRVFCTARILTDIRPVFGPEVNEKPTEAAIVHMLKVTYHDEGAHRSVYFALDDGDLDRLTAAIDRARAKSATLKAVLASAGVPYPKES